MNTEKIKQRAIEIGKRRFSTTVLAISQGIGGEKQHIDNTVNYRMWLIGKMLPFGIDEDDMNELISRVDDIIYRLAEQEILMEEIIAGAN